MKKFPLVLAACMVVSAAATDSGRVEQDLGVWKRFIETPWKEYGTDGAIQHVLFTLTAPDIVTITVRTNQEVRARVIVRLKGDRTARYCPVREGNETCDATIVFDDRGVSYTFDDPQRLPEHALLVTPNMFVHSREAEGVKFEQETYASDAFDQSAAVRQAAHDSMLRYKRGVEEAKRRRIEKAGQAHTSVSTVRSADGTQIAIECAGAGPSLVIVHGGTGDRRRWTPLFPLLAPQFRVCAMDRRAHGASGDSLPYSLQKEVEDVVAVVASQPGPVFVLGHSFGAVCAFEAAFHTAKIARLALYEPPVRAANHSATLERMEEMIRTGDRETALMTFMTDIVMMSAGEVAAMKARQSWAGLVATVESSVRQDRALSQYRFDPARARAMTIPTLLMVGSKTTSPELTRSIDSLRETLPAHTLRTFDGQEHNAMDTIPQEFAAALSSFLLEPHR